MERCVRKRLLPRRPSCVTYSVCVFRNHVQLRRVGYPSSQVRSRQSRRARNQARRNRASAPVQTRVGFAGQSFALATSTSASATVYKKGKRSIYPLGPPSPSSSLRVLGTTRWSRSNLGQTSREVRSLIRLPSRRRQSTCR